MSQQSHRQQVEWQFLWAIWEAKQEDSEIKRTDKLSRGTESVAIEPSDPLWSLIKQNK